MSLFDEPVAVALKEKKKGAGKNGDEDLIILALEDRCSHRGAALSEGRITASGCLQCPYHGWTFDASGDCVAIPHAPGAARREAEEKGSSASRRRTKVRAYASAVSQGLVWLSLSPPEKSPPPLSKIATLPELDLPGWVSNDFVRDFDGIDFTLLIQNVADPDHGLFAHQTPSFDVFSAAVGMPMRVTMRRGRGEEEGDDGGKESNKMIVGRVEAAPVLTKGSSASSPPSPSSSSAVAELVFEPPCHVRWARMDAAEGAKEEEAKFIAAFYVTPLGLGRSRLFIRYARCLLPQIPVPRPLLAMALNGFLDQDSMVVASQALRVARAEAQAAAAAEVEGEEEEGGGEKGGKPNRRSSLSRSLFNYRSPSETFLASVASWLDEALPAAPGRDAAALRSLVNKLESSSSSKGGGGLGGGYPDREEVLDRFRYHTQMVPSSKKVWEVAKKVEEVGKGVALVAAAAALAVLSTTTTTTTATNEGAAAAALLASAAFLASLSSFAASDVASRFEFCYTRERQAADLGRIAALAPPELERASKEERA